MITTLKKLGGGQSIDIGKGGPVEKTTLYNSKFSLLLERCLVEVTKLNLGQDSEARFGQDFKFKLSRDTDVGLRF